jgi:DnaJ-class molecular chaperone
MTDLYRLLEVSRNATPDEIRASYRKLSRKCHPDINPDKPDTQAKFCELTNARDVLLDREKRRVYDMGGYDAISQLDQMRQQQDAARRKSPPTEQKVKVSLKQIYKGETIQYTTPSGQILPLCLKTLPLGQTISVPNMGACQSEGQIPGDLHLIFDLIQDQPPYRLSINNNNIVLEHDLKFGDVLTGYEIMFNHPTGKMLIRDKWTSSHLGNQTRVYRNLGLRGGNLVVKCKIKTETLSAIPEETIRKLKIECPVLFSPPLVYDTEARDISKLGREQNNNETLSNGGMGGMANGMKFGMEMSGNGCAQQ